MSGALDVTVDAAALREALAGGVYGPVSGLPYYRHTLLRGTVPGTLEVISSDTAITRTVALTAEAAAGAGTVCARAEQLRAALGGLSGPVVLRGEGVNLTLHSGRRRFRIDCLDVEGFPIPEPLEEDEVTIDGEQLREAIRAVAYACKREWAAQPSTWGVRLEHDTVVALDPHRIAVCPADIGVKRGITVPQQAVQKVLGLLGPGARCWLLRSRTAEPHAVQFARGEERLMIALRDGPYPDWRRLLESVEYGEPIAFLAAELKAAVGRVSAFGGKLPTLAFATDGSDLLVTPHDNGEAAADRVPLISGVTTEERLILAQYIDDVLTAAGGASVQWSVPNAPQKPDLFSIDGRPDKHYIAPMRR